MSNLATFKTQLLEEAIAYTKYLETLPKTNPALVAYPVEQVKAIEHIINNSNRCKGLQFALTQQMEQHLNPKRSIGERWRGVFSWEKHACDLYNNLKTVLIAPKYRPEKLEHYDEMAELEERLTHNLRQEFIHQQTVNPQEERLRKLNAELHTRIEHLTQEVESLRKERDQWKNQCEATQHENQRLTAENLQVSTKLYNSQREVVVLKQQVSKASYQQAQQALPKAVLFQPQVKG